MRRKRNYMKCQEDLNQYTEAYEKNRVYSLENKYLSEFYTERIIEKERLNHRKSVLELGIGDGKAISIIDSKLKSIEKHVVIEEATDLIQSYKENNLGSKIKIVESYFEDYVTDENFDLIIMGFVLEHVLDPVEIIRKYRQYLSDTGKIYIVVPNCESLNRRIGYYAGLLSDLQMLTENDLLLGHKRYYSVDKLKKDVVAAQCEVLSIEGCLLKPITTMQMSQLGFDDEIFSALLKIGISYPELSLGILLEAK